MDDILEKAYLKRFQGIVEAAKERDGDFHDLLCKDSCICEK